MAADRNIDAIVAEALRAEGCRKLAGRFARADLPRSDLWRDFRKLPVTKRRAVLRRYLKSLTGGR